jgi:hypothetical protein
MKSLFDILSQITTTPVKNIREDDQAASSSSNTIIPPFSEDDRVGATLQRLDQMGEMIDDLYNTVSHLDEIDNEVYLSVSSAYNSVDDLYEDVDNKHDIIPVDLEGDDYDIDEEVELEEAFRPGHSFTPAPIGKDTFAAAGVMKLWGLKMRAGKWADTFIALYDDGSFSIIDDGKQTKYDSGEAVLAAIKKMAKEGVELFGDSLTEVLSKDAPSSEWIDDFVKSDAPQFKGKTKKERIKMALGAYYAAQKNEDVELDESFADIAPVVVALATNLGILAGGLGAPMIMKYFRKDSDFEKASKIVATLADKDSEFKSLMKKVSDFEYKTSPEAKSARKELLTYLRNNVNDSTFTSLKGHLYKAAKTQSAMNEHVELTESFRPGYNMIPAPIGVNTVKSPGLRKLWGTKSGSTWDTTFVGMWDDGAKPYGIIDAQGTTKFAKLSDFEKAIKKVAKMEDMDESTNLPKIKELVSLALIDEKDVPATIAALKASQSDKVLTPAQTKLLGNLAVMLANVILGDTSALSSVKRAAKE